MIKTSLISNYLINTESTGFYHRPRYEVIGRRVIGRTLDFNPRTVLGPRCLLLYINRRQCKAIICSRRLQQTTFSDAFFLGALRAKTPTQALYNDVLYIHTGFVAFLLTELFLCPKGIFGDM